MYRIAMGGDYEGGLTPAQRALWEGHLLYMENCYCTFALLCSTDLMKEIAPVGRNCSNPLSPTNLGEWGITVIAA